MRGKEVGVRNSTCTHVSPLAVTEPGQVSRPDERRLVAATALQSVWPAVAAGPPQGRSGAAAQVAPLPGPGLRFQHGLHSAVAACPGGEPSGPPASGPAQPAVSRPVPHAAGRPDAVWPPAGTEEPRILRRSRPRSTRIHEHAAGSSPELGPGI